MTPASAEVSGSDREQVLVPPFLIIIYTTSATLLVQALPLFQCKDFRGVCALYRHDLTAEYVRSILDYNPETGDLTWRATKSGRRSKTAGTTGEWGNHGKRRRTITIDGVIYKAHRIIWLWMTGGWPPRMIDHEDRDSLNNRWLNLRLATPLLNSHNRDPNRNNTSGTPGVCWDSRYDRWKVSFRKKHYGYFDRQEDAVRFASLIQAFLSAAP
jgi:hypothetical protein